MLALFLPKKEDHPDYRIIVVLISVPIILTLMEFLGLPWHFLHLFPQVSRIYPVTTVNLLAFVYWSCFCGLAYMGIPAFLTHCIFSEGISQYGLRLKGITTHLWIYLVLYLLVLPVIIGASFGPSFQRTYPFYSPVPGGWALFLIFEIFYLLQFFYLEFFFRGYVLFNLEKKFGYYSVFIMTIPYCMIHYHKPMLEALAAIIAGIILGTLALRTRSIWYGVLIHASVALTMDILALHQKGLLLKLFLH
jgi:uncharacterized protein